MRTSGSGLGAFGALPARTIATLQREALEDTIRISVAAAAPAPAINLRLSHAKARSLKYRALIAAIDGAGARKSFPAPALPTMRRLLFLFQFGALRFDQVITAEQRLEEGGAFGVALLHVDIGIIRLDKFFCAYAILNDEIGSFQQRV